MIGFSLLKRKNENDFFIQPILIFTFSFHCHCSDSLLICAIGQKAIQSLVLRSCWRFSVAANRWTSTGNFCCVFFWYTFWWNFFFFMNFIMKTLGTFWRDSGGILSGFCYFYSRFSLSRSSQLFVKFIKSVLCRTGGFCSSRRTDSKMWIAKNRFRRIGIYLLVLNQSF